MELAQAAMARRDDEMRLPLGGDLDSADDPETKRYLRPPPPPIPMY